VSERFEEMVVLLTGGGTGIGHAAALAFGGEGARVVIGGLEGPELEATRPNSQIAVLTPARHGSM
jgi:NAD(P)-dependent dehydrogenase (short-subunit alcohol dehydrogenase family)